jgi:hypothetical protein
LPSVVLDPDVAAVLAAVLADAAAGGPSNALPAFGIKAVTGAATVAAVPLTMPPAVVAAEGAATTAAVTGGVADGVEGDVRAGESLSVFAKPLALHSYRLI